MVIIWNDLACGDREAAAVLVALNSAFQVIAFGALGWFYPAGSARVVMSGDRRARGRAWYEERFLPRVGPVALYGLLFTIVILFALQGDTITNQPTDVARIALPLLAYFALMWSGAGVVEHSVYICPHARGQGIGAALLTAFIAATEANGIWTVQTGIFPENIPSLRHHAKVGFRTVGTRRGLGRLHGQWRDVVLLERRSPTVL